MWHFFLEYLKLINIIVIGIVSYHFIFSSPKNKLSDINNTFINIHEGRSLS